MRSRLNLIMNNANLLNHKSLLILGTMDFSLEARLVGKLFQYTDHIYETRSRKSGIKSEQGITEKEGLTKLEDLLAKESAYSLPLIPTWLGKIMVLLYYLISIFTPC